VCVSWCGMGRGVHACGRMNGGYFEDYGCGGRIPLLPPLYGEDMKC
jgi:hypothetical protein